MLEFLSYEILTLDNQAIESRLLHDCGDSNVRHTKEDTVHDDEGLSERVGKCQEGGIHGFGVKLDKNKVYSETIISMAESK
jgi:hypothetical protein